MNHLEQLAAEWLTYNEYIVRAAVPIAPRAKGGYDGEIDVAAISLITNHFVHIECSLDADSKTERDRKFQKKFDLGRTHIRALFPGLKLPDKLDQVVLHQFARYGNGPIIGGGRLVTVRDLIHEIIAGLKGTSPARGAVPSNLALIRTIQVMADALNIKPAGARLIPENAKSLASSK